ncbi:MAG TPA: GDSL-type esterase/lipase family protein [Chitinophagaceae bacterium]|nr:GDSL-type esterase/lipase family protein [Chitinophagaceae bacterium]
MKQQLKIILFLTLLVTGACAQEQKPPFWNEVQSFKKQDSLSFPASGQILLIGSSSFTMWTDVQTYFPGHPILNRAFGGSSLPDVIRYAKDIVLPYHPKQIIVYCGENDLAGDSTVNGEKVYERFKELFELVRSYYPGIPVAYVSMKPSPSRRKLLPKMEQGNRLIKHFMAQQVQTSYIDVYSRMLNPDHSLIGDIYREDSLHMNKKGYVIWQKIIEPYLVK